MKTLVFILSSALLIGCGNKAANKEATASTWTAEQDQTYIKECVGNGSVPTMSDVCPCLLQKVKAEKISFEDRNKTDSKIAANYEKWYMGCMDSLIGPQLQH